MRAIESLLWVSDGHAAPGESAEEFERFSWLGHYIAKEKPAVIVLGGDFWDNPSLNGHRGSTLLPAAGKELPGQAAKHDLIADWEVGKSAISTILGVYRADNERHRRDRHRDREYHPTIYYLEGNHEDFWNRASARHPSLGSILSSRAAADFMRDYGAEWVPARVKLILGGCAFQHFHPNDRGKPIPLNSLLNRLLMSNVSGHEHGYGEREETRGDGRVQRAIVGGNWKSPLRQSHGDRAGLLMMRDLRDGEFHHQFIPQHVVAREYRHATRRLAA